jgi:hypothetical protein
MADASGSLQRTSDDINPEHIAHLCLRGTRSYWQ